MLWMSLSFTPAAFNLVPSPLLNACQPNHAPLMYCGISRRDKLSRSRGRIDFSPRKIQPSTPAENSLCTSSKSFVAGHHENASFTQLRQGEECSHQWNFVLSL